MPIKGIMDYIGEDDNLQKKITYKEYESGITAPKNTDYTVAEAYDAYCKALEVYNNDTKAGEDR